MKRVTLWSLSTLLLMLLASPVQSAATSRQAAEGLAPLAAAELSAVTAGVCLKCDEPTDPPPKKTKPRIQTYIWEAVSSKHNVPTELRHELARDYVNSGAATARYSFTYNDECSHVLTSGGVGVSTGLNLNVGTVYTCAMQDNYEVVVPARTRAKVYRAFMRQIASYTFAEYAVYTDGSTVATGARDSGIVETRYLRYNTIFSPL